MSSFFKTFIDQGFALVYIVDILLLSNSREHMFKLIEQLHLISTNHNLKLAPEKSLLMLLKVNILRHEIKYNTIKPITSKITAIPKVPSPTGKVVSMSFIGALNFFTSFFENYTSIANLFTIFYTKTLYETNWAPEYELFLAK